MKTQLSLVGDAKTLDALSRFLRAFEQVSPEPACSPKAIRGEDNVIYVEAGYRTEEETFLVGDRMAEVGADILEETGVLIALAPFVVEETRRT
jgi:hypothetical protein